MKQAAVSPARSEVPPIGGSLDPMTQVGPDPIIEQAAEVLGLTQNLAELESRGFTVVPPERVGPSQFLHDLKAAVVAVHERRSQLAGQADELALHAKLGIGRLMRQVIWDDEIFERAAMNPVVQTLARALTGHSCRLSLCDASIKPPGGEPLAIHCDTRMTEPYPLLPQFVNVTYALSDYSPENGTTVFVPGSHRLLRQPFPGEGSGLTSSVGELGVKAPDLVPVTCPAGSIIAWSGLTWHAALPRTAPGDRVSLLLLFSRWYLKTEENFRDDIPEAALARWEHNPRFRQMLDVNCFYGYSHRRPRDPQRAVESRTIFPIL